MFGVSSFFIDNNFHLEQNFIKYDQVIQKDRILIEKNLHALLGASMPKGEISALSGGKSGDSLYIGEFDTRKIVIRIMTETNSKTFIKQLSYSQLAAQNQLGPQVLHHHVEQGIVITEFIDGTPLLPSIVDTEKVLLQLSRALQTIHQSESFTGDIYDIFEVIEIELKNLAQKYTASALFLEKYLNYIHEVDSAIKTRNLTPAHCHNDIHRANVFYDLNKDIQFIDWGDAGLGDPFFDLARASIEFHFSKDQTEKFLNEYFSGNISLVDRAHFVLMQQLALLKIGLHFLDLPSLDETTKDSVRSYLKKNGIEKDMNSINSSQDVSKIIFNLFEDKVFSDESKQALLTLKQLRNTC